MQSVYRLASNFFFLDRLKTVLTATDVDYYTVLITFLTVERVKAYPVIMRTS